ncbi:hypothetical protein MATL_G00094230 [Megalops atlanticus]|uniref:Uncharacterized protein n=1 Tax=Megalops atlanticus TaxID=7932 RepID=A0A9D3Q555_MEGAT|nr:hypothetical protein MATL_G00094230 [Megalops atlanticus]
MTEPLTQSLRRSRRCACSPPESITGSSSSSSRRLPEPPRCCSLHRDGKGIYNPPRLPAKSCDPRGRQERPAAWGGLAHARVLTPDRRTRERRGIWRRKPEARGRLTLQPGRWETASRCLARAPLPHPPPSPQPRGACLLSAPSRLGSRLSTGH